MGSSKLSAGPASVADLVTFMLMSMLMLMEVEVVVDVGLGGAGATLVYPESHIAANYIYFKLNHAGVR